jgi:hypothetical protein
MIADSAILSDIGDCEKLAAFIRLHSDWQYRALTDFGKRQQKGSESKDFWRHLPQNAICVKKNIDRTVNL